MTGTRLDLRTQSEAQTRLLGCVLAGQLRPGDVVALDGDLGAGKTMLTAGIAAGLGVRGAVASPTFVLERIHPAGERGIALHHFDLYRLAGVEEAEDLGLEETLDGPDVCVLEWAERAAALLPERALHVTLLREDDTTRRVTVTLGGPDAGTRTAALRQALEKEELL